MEGKGREKESQRRGRKKEKQHKKVNSRLIHVFDKNNIEHNFLPSQATKIVIQNQRFRP